MTSLRCRPGDMAVIVAADPGCQRPNIGRIVTVQSINPGMSLKKGRPMWYVTAHEPLVAYEGMTKLGIIADALLQPIRGQQRPDGITTAADKPQTAEA